MRRSHAARPTHHLHPRARHRRRAGRPWGCRCGSSGSSTTARIGPWARASRMSTAASGSLIDELVTGVYRLTFELHLWRPRVLPRGDAGDRRGRRARARGTCRCSWRPTASPPTGAADAMVAAGHRRSSTRLEGRVPGHASSPLFEDAPALPRAARRLRVPSASWDELFGESLSASRWPTPEADADGAARRASRGSARHPAASPRCPSGSRATTGSSSERDRRRSGPLNDAYEDALRLPLRDLRGGPAAVGDRAAAGARARRRSPRRSGAAGSRDVVAIARARATGLGSWRRSDG